MNKNTKLTKEEVKHVAELAKLNLTDAEIDKFTIQLSNVISYVEELNAVNVGDIKETNQTTGLKNVLRSDKTKEGIDQNEALSQAKKIFEGYFLVEGILEDN